MLIIGCDGSGFDVAVEEAIAMARRYCLPLPEEGLTIERRDGRLGGWLLTPGPWQRPERDALGGITTPVASEARLHELVAAALAGAGVTCEHDVNLGEGRRHFDADIEEDDQ